MKAYLSKMLSNVCVNVTMNHRMATSTRKKSEGNNNKKKKIRKGGGGGGGRMRDRKREIDREREEIWSIQRERREIERQGGEMHGV